MITESTIILAIIGMVGLFATAVTWQRAAVSPLSIIQQGKYVPLSDYVTMPVTISGANYVLSCLFVQRRIHN